MIVFNPISYFGSSPSQHCCHASTDAIYTDSRNERQHPHKYQLPFLEGSNQSNKLGLIYRIPCPRSIYFETSNKRRGSCADVDILLRRLPCSGRKEDLVKAVMAGQSRFDGLHIEYLPSSRPRCTFISIKVTCLAYFVSRTSRSDKSGPQPFLLGGLRKCSLTVEAQLPGSSRSRA